MVLTIIAMAAAAVLIVCAVAVAYILDDRFN